MKRRSLWRWLVAFVVLGAALLVCRVASPLLTTIIRLPPVEFSRLTAAQWREDLHYLLKRLPRAHVNAFTVISEDEFTLDIERLASELTGLTGDQVLVQMMAIVAQLGDAHTGLDAFGAGTGTLPVRVRWFSDGLFVVQSTSQFRDVLGMKLVGLGENSIDEVYQTVRSIVPRVNESWTRVMSQQYMTNARVLNALGVCPTNSSIQATFERADGTRFSVELPASVGANGSWLNATQTRPLYEQQSDAPYWYRYLADHRAVYVRFSQCVGVRSFAAVSEEIWKLVRAERAQYMIVDLRGNRGGNSLVLGPLLSALMADPTFSQAGHLYVAIDKETFSSAVHNAVRLRDDCKAVLVGEPSGGRPNSFGEVRALRLPNSRLTVTYSTKESQLTSEDSESLIPSSVVLTSSAEYFSGRDPVLDEILRLISLSER